MKKILIATALCLTSVVLANAQEKLLPSDTQTRVQGVTGVDVSYKDGSLMRVVGDQAQFTYEDTGKKTTKTELYLDYGTMTYYQMIISPHCDTVTIASPFQYNKGLTVVRTERYNSWDCNVARATIDSSVIEIWYTDNIGYKGTPMPCWGVPEGVVFKITRNGEIVFDVYTSSQTTFSESVFPDSWGKMISTKTTTEKEVKCTHKKKHKSNCLSA